MDEYDIAIVGAGASGLAAAHTLAEASFSTVLIEARNRVGGRIHTIYPESADLAVELGAEFIHGKPPETWNYLRMANIPITEANGAVWSAGDAGFLPDRAGTDEFLSLLEAVNAWRGNDLSLREFSDTHFSDRLWDSARDRASSYAEDYLGADTAQISVAWMADVEKAISSVQGSRYFRGLRGYKPLLDWLSRPRDAERLVLHLNTVAETIHWSPGRVEITAATLPDSQPIAFHARAAIITLPLGVLALSANEKGAVQFFPDIPAKWAALDKVVMGHSIKVIFEFHEAFWDTLTPSAQTLAQLGFLYSSVDRLLPSWWTSYPLVTPFLTGWMGGPRAQQLATCPEEEIIDYMLGALSRCWHRSKSDMAAQLKGWYFHNWSRDPFAHGAYSWVRVGGLGASDILRAPVSNTLFFAGEALNSGGYTSTVHAAFRSGIRAAHEVLACLGSADVPHV